MDQVKAEIKNNIGIVRLCNPPVNYMTGTMVKELETLFKKWEHDANVRCIVITGDVEGKFITHFSPDDLGDSIEQKKKSKDSKASNSGKRKGGKKPNVKLLVNASSKIIKLYKKAETRPWLNRFLNNILKATPAAALPELNRIHNVFAHIERMPKPVIAAINGTCMGGGYELALSCDYRFMKEGDYSLGLIEVLAGIIPGAGGTIRIAKLLGTAKAKELLLNGEVNSAQRAEQLGLITKAIPADNFMEEVMDMAQKLAHRPLKAVAAIKSIMQDLPGLSVEEAYHREKLSFVETGISKDTRSFGAFYNEEMEKGTSAPNIFKIMREGGGPKLEGE